MVTPPSPPAPPLICYVVYKNPSDYPGMFVVRRQYANADGVVADPEPLAVEAHYAVAQVAIPLGLYNLGREPGDDSAILEVWI